MVDIWLKPTIVNHMVEYNESLDVTFRALADPTRRAMLQRLASGPQRVSELAEPFEMSLAAASKHIRSLEAAGLVERHISGRSHICNLRANGMRAAMEWLCFYERFWNDGLDRLNDALASENTADHPGEK